MMKRKKTINKRPTFLKASWDAWRIARAGKNGIAQRQQERLQELVTYARTQSRYYEQVYRDVPKQDIYQPTPRHDQRGADESF